MAQVTKICFANTPPINLTRARTAPEQTKRKRKTYCEIDNQEHQERRIPAGKMEALSNLSAKTLGKFQRIAGPEILSTLWYYLRAKRCSLRNKQPGPSVGAPDPLDASVEGQLSRYHLQYRSIKTSNAYFAEVPRRLYLAKIAGLYIKEILARRQNPPQRKRRRTNRDDGWDASNRSLRNIFVDFLLPQLQLQGDTRLEATTRFGNWVRLGRTCAKLIESFGVGILLLLPRDLWNDK